MVRRIYESLLRLLEVEVAEVSMQNMAAVLLLVLVGVHFVKTDT